MDLQPLSFSAGLDEYQKQAEALLEERQAGNDAPLGMAGAQLALARRYSFRDWQALVEYVEAVTRENSEVFQFESAAEALITGDEVALATLLRAYPELIRTRSTRATCFDPPVHRATLLHYVAANGVENHRQKTPRNAVAIAKILLAAGAEPDALADMYGGHYATMSLLVSSCHPAQAGVQVALVDTLVDFGASVEARGSAKWGSPLMTALAFGCLDAAEALVRRGARVGNIAAAAGLGRLEDVGRLLAGADARGRHRALALAAQLGHVEIVRLLLDAGEDASRYNPDGNHAHSTPLHQAALAGHEAVVRLLVERGARLDIKDKIHHGTPLDWAIYGKQERVELYLRLQGGPGLSS